MGAEVTWDGENRTVVGVKSGRTVEISVGKSRMYVNGSQILLDTPPIVLGGRTLVPARAVAEGMGCEVSWDGGRQLVSIAPKQ